MNHILFVPYPTFSDDKNIYFRLELLYGRFPNNTVIGSGSAILARATLTEEAHFSYYDYYLYDENLLDMLDDNHEEEALESCNKVAKAIWG